ncbi:MAG: head completion/stabilization protein [Victivallaceae bacterium]|nr:head completion/stabilization protein [Victivallaceae bacterium]
MDWGSDTGQPENQTIDAGAFWPAIETDPFYNRYRIPNELPIATVIDHLRLAVVSVRRALRVWQLEQGVPTLAEVTQEQIDGKGELALLWERAVYCEAKANLLQETKTVDRREQAENAAKTAEETEDKYREFAADAIAAICGQTSTCVTLI